MPRKMASASNPPATSVSVPSVSARRSPLPSVSAKLTDASKLAAQAQKIDPPKTRRVTTKAPLVKAAAKKTTLLKTKAKPAKAKPFEVTDGHSMMNLSNAMNGVTAEQIAERAYFRWLERGCPMGSPEEDWLCAEQDLGIAR